MKLRPEVQELLAIDGRAGDFLRQGALQDAARAIAADATPSLLGQMLGPYQSGRA